MQKSFHYTKDETKERIWEVGVGERKPEEIINITSIGTIFYWIDEFIGHSITLDNEYDNLYISLNEAFKHADFAAPRTTKRRQKKIVSVRNLMIFYLNKQRLSVCSTEVDNWQEKLRNLNKKPVYVKK